MAFFNFIWFVVFGWWQALVYLVLAAVFAVTIVGIPIAKSLLQFTRPLAFPFGKEIVRETELKGSDNVSALRRVFGAIVNVIWLPFGIVLAAVNVASGILSFISIFGIPNGVVYFRAARFVVWPIGAKCVTKKQAFAAAAAREVEKVMKKED